MSNEATITPAKDISSGYILELQEQLTTTQQRCATLRGNLEAFNQALNQANVTIAQANKTIKDLTLQLDKLQTKPTSTDVVIDGDLIMPNNNDDDVGDKYDADDINLVVDDDNDDDDNV